MRVMAVDYGDVRTGIAVSDPTGLIAGEAWTVTAGSLKKAAEAIISAAESRGVLLIVLGLPKNMDGTLGPRAEKSAELKALLEKMGPAEVLLWDERRTTADAHRILSESGKRHKKHKGTVDAVAASLILEGYLQSRR